jgi:hypothetical protein
MTTWALCSIMFSETYEGGVKVHSTEELDLSWLENQYTEAIFHADLVNTGFMKTKSVPNKGQKLGDKYPFWEYSLKGSPKIARNVTITYQIAQYLLANGWEPYSAAFPFAGSLSAGSGTIAGVSQLLFRKIHLD